MAEKRMFNAKVLDTDAFLDMPLSAQALYFHLNLRADDDGFVSSPKRIQTYIGASEDDLKLLVAKRFLIAFPDGVMVVKHWRMHNTIKKDRYTPTDYQEDLRLLGLKENKAYTLEISEMVAKCFQNGSNLEPKCLQNVSTDIGLDKDIDIDKDINNNIPPKPITDVSKNVVSKAARTSYETEFESFWSVYPRKIEKATAYKCYKARLSDGWNPADLIKAAEAYAAQCTKDHTDSKYIKHPATFLSASTPFTDYIPKTQDQPKNDNPDDWDPYSDWR